MNEQTLPHLSEDLDRGRGDGKPSGPVLLAPPVLAADDMPTQLEKTKPVAFTAPSRFFGDYELLVEVARGGMGVVYRARQIKLNRVVALKMILAGRLANPEDVQRFRTEAEAAARLSHPNIVAVHEVGEIDGQHFFSMEFIEGTSLAQRVSSGPLPGRDAARYVRQIAKAIHYAHRQGILHRDIKPSNIMLGADDEPHITDFGLAKRLGDHDSGQTRTGAILGTPSYMAPEQAKGKNQELGPACDIYSLGALLYELLTGRPPFRAETPLDTVMQVINNEAAPATLLNPNIDKDLETICHKCLEKDPAQRYPSAEALALDLQNYLDGNPISARNSNVISRLQHMLERSHHDADFATWSSMILIMAAIIGFQHSMIFVLMQLRAPHWTILGARTFEFLLLGWLFWRNRNQGRLLPTSSAERELWTIWIGYFFALLAIVVVNRMLHFLDVLAPTASAPEHLSECLPYPFMAIASGMAFFIMGSNYWGRCYAFGLAFFGLGCFLPFALSWAPLLFGLLWAATLTMVGLHLRELIPKKGQSETTSEQADEQRRPTLAADPPPAT